MINSKQTFKISFLACSGKASSGSSYNLAQKLVKYGTAGELDFASPAKPGNPDTYYFYPKGTDPKATLPTKIIRLSENGSGSGDTCFLIPYG